MSERVEFALNGIESYNPDPDLESKDGVWLLFPQGRRIRVLRAGGSNHRYNKAFNKAMAPYQQELRSRSMDSQLLQQITQDVYARTIVVELAGWNGKDGKEIPTSYSNIMALFRQVPGVFDVVVQRAMEMATFVAEEADTAADAAKNS